VQSAIKIFTISIVVHQILQDHSQIAATPQAMADLQALASALLDTVNDKNLALSHQRKTNKYVLTLI